MFSVTDIQLLELIGLYFFPFCRIGAFFLAAPVFGSQLVNTRTRLIFALVVTAISAPLLPEVDIKVGINLATLLAVVQQMLIGFAMGFILQIVFHVFVLAGQLIAMKMGLGFASMNDPSNGITVTVVSQFYLMLSTLLFLSLNGHLIALEVLIDSFNVMPVAMFGITREALWHVLSIGSWMFQGALLLALPVLTSILIVNIAFGVMNRSAPQMNVFTVGFPITLIFGLLLIWFSLVSFLPNYQIIVNEGFQFVDGLLEAK